MILSFLVTSLLYHRKAMLRISLRWWRSSSRRKLITTTTSTCDRGRWRIWSFHQYPRPTLSPSLNPCCWSISTRLPSAGELSIMQSSEMSSASAGRVFQQRKVSLPLPFFFNFQFFFFWQTHFFLQPFLLTVVKWIIIIIMTHNWRIVLGFPTDKIFMATMTETLTIVNV